MIKHNVLCSTSVLVFISVYIFQIIEISNFDDKVERLDTTDELITGVQSLQQYGIIRQQLATKYVINTGKI